MHLQRREALALRAEVPHAYKLVARGADEAHAVRGEAHIAHVVPVATQNTAILRPLPFIIQPHEPAQHYFAANSLWRWCDRWRESGGLKLPLAEPLTFTVGTGVQHLRMECEPAMYTIEGGSLTLQCTMRIRASCDKMQGRMHPNAD